MSRQELEVIVLITEAMKTLAYKVRETNPGLDISSIIADCEEAYETAATNSGG